MAWGSISLFAGFLEKENSLETLIVIFENGSPKGFFRLNMKNFEISVFTANSIYRQPLLRPYCNHSIVTNVTVLPKYNFVLRAQLPHKNPEQLRVYLRVFVTQGNSLK